MAPIQVELCKLQEWVRHKGLRIIVVFEGRDAAGKGGTIKALTERVSPRVFRVVALPAPSDREKSQNYLQRYMQHFPAAGEIVMFHRSWYNRAGVECVMGFCSKEEYERFFRVCPIVEKFIVDSGIQLIKFGLEASNEEQKPAKHDANAPASRNARVAKLALTFLGLPRSPWCRYSPFPKREKAIVTPKLTVHLDAIGEFW